MTVKEDVLHDLLFQSMERYVKLKMQFDDQAHDNRPIKRKKNSSLPQGPSFTGERKQVNSEEDLLDFINHS